MAEVRIPVVDFSCFDCFNHERGINFIESNAEIKKLAQGIYEAFTTIGFVYIKNHGISNEKISKLFEVAENFFTLPYETKQPFATELSESNYHGWMAAGRQIVEPNEPYDYKEAFDIEKPFNNDIPWPCDSCPDFKKTVRSFFQLCEKLAHGILDLISYSLELKDQSFLTNVHGKIGTADNKTSLRLLYYPYNEELPEGQIRLGKHTDYGTITLLFQDEVGGLELLSQKNGFLSAHPIEGAVLVNIGDLLERWTNHKLVSTAHRVVVPRHEKVCLSSRKSAAFFVIPDSDTVIKCLDGSKQYPPITAKDYLNQRLKDTHV